MSVTASKLGLHLDSKSAALIITRVGVGLPRASRTRAVVTALPDRCTMPGRLVWCNDLRFPIHAHREMWRPRCGEGTRAGRSWRSRIGDRRASRAVVTASLDRRTRPGRLVWCNDLGFPIHAHREMWRPRRGKATGSTHLGGPGVVDGDHVVGRPVGHVRRRMARISRAFGRIAPAAGGWTRGPCDRGNAVIKARIPDADPGAAKIRRKLPQTILAPLFCLD